MNKHDLDPQEQDLLESYKRGEWRSIKNVAEERSRLVEFTRAASRKDSRINIRISSRDLDEIRKKALEEGLPYQTLISSILHKYISGRLIERPR